MARGKNLAKNISKIKARVIRFWDEELEMMNAGKVGRRFEYPNSLIVLLGIIRVAFNISSFRKLEGMSTLFFDRVPDYTRINRRIRQLSVNTIEKINREITKTRTRGKSLEIIMDGTGVQINGKYVWMDVRKKGKKIRKRDWRKLHIAVDIETGNILATKVLNRDENEGSHENTADPLGDVLGNIDDTASIIRAFLDGAYDGEDNFDMLEYLDIDPVIRTRKPPREKAERMSRALKTKKREKFFSKLRDRVALLQHVWDRYVEVKGFGKRGGIEGVIGSFKRTFGERLFSKIDDMIHREILLRVLVWNIMH